jgi:hypothetical protein
MTDEIMQLWREIYQLRDEIELLKRKVYSDGR